MLQITQITRVDGAPTSVKFNNGIIRHFDNIRKMWLASEHETRLIEEAVEELREKPYYHRTYNLKTVAYYDGLRKHPDGSDWLEVHIFRSLKKMNEFIYALARSGYEERD